VIFPRCALGIDDTIAAAVAPSLLEHRDYIYETYLELPVVID